MRILSKKFSSVYFSILKLKNLANEINISISQLSLLWVLDIKEINEVVIGVDTQRQLKENYETINKNIDLEIYNEIKNIKFNDSKY